MLTSSEDHGALSVLKIATTRLTSADYVTLKSAQTEAMERGQSGLLIDLSAVRRVAQSGMAALLECQSEAPRGLSFGYFGARPKVLRALEGAKLTKLLSIFETKDAAVAAPEFRTCLLASVKAVILVAGAGSRMAPLTRETPKPMLDFLGKPVVERLMDHLSAFGVRDFILNPGHKAPQFHDHFKRSAQRSVQFFNEGYYEGQTWQAHPLGSASSLVSLQKQASAFDNDFLVFCGDALCDIDVAEMMAQHRQSGADVTIAVQSVPRDQVQKYGIIKADARGKITGFVEKPAPELAPSTLASTGIYIFHPRVLRRLQMARGDLREMDIAQDLLPAVLSSGEHMQIYQGRFNWSDMGCPKDYYLSASRGLRGLISGMCMQGEEVRRGVWLAPGAHLSPRAVVVGPCYIGPGAEIRAGAKIDGPSVIGAQAVIEEQTLIRRSIVMPQTQVTRSTWVDNMIVSANWAVDHRFADGSPCEQAPLEGVEALSWREDELVSAAGSR